MQVWITTSEGALMANFKRSSNISNMWLGLILVGGAGAIGGNVSFDLNLSSEEEAPVQESLPGYDRRG